MASRRQARASSRRGSMFARRSYRREMRGEALLPNDPQAKQMGSSSSPRAQRAIRSLKLF